MVDKFRPLDYLPQGIYDARYWNIIAEDTFNLFSRLFVSGHTGKFPAAPGRVISIILKGDRLDAGYVPIL